MLPSWYPVPYAPSNGVFCEEQARAVAGSGADVGVIFPDLRSVRTIKRGLISRNNFQTRVERAGRKTTYIWGGWNYRPGGYDLEFIKYTRRLFIQYVAENGLPNLIHAHACFPAGIAARQLSEEFDIPYVITEHWTGFATQRLDDKVRSEAGTVFNGAKCVIAVSSILKKSIQAIAPECEVRVIPNGVDTEIFSPLNGIERQMDEDNEFIFCTVGHLIKRKRVDLLIESIKQLKDNGFKCKLVICGGGPEMDKLSSMSDSLGLSNEILFKGESSQNDIKQILKNADAFILVSEYETFGVVYLEAMSMGLPVIATTRGAPPEFIPQNAGICVDPADTTMVVTAMKRIIEQREAYNSHEIRTFIRETFDFTIIAEEIINIYRSVLENK